MGKQARLSVFESPGAMQQDLAFRVDRKPLAGCRVPWLVAMPKRPGWVNAALYVDRELRTVHQVWWLFVGLDGRVDVMPPPTFAFAVP